MKNLLILFTTAGLLSSCANYYKAVLAPAPINAKKIEELQNAGRYFILRDTSSSFTMTNISFSTDQKTLQCTLDSMPPYEHRLHIAKKKKNNLIYKDKKMSDVDESEVLNEVHVYVVTHGETRTGPCTLQLDQIQKIEVLEKDNKKTNTSHAIGLALGIGGTAVVAAAIIGVVVYNSIGF